MHSPCVCLASGLKYFRKSTVFIFCNLSELNMLEVLNKYESNNDCNNEIANFVVKHAEMLFGITCQRNSTKF